MFFFFFQKCSPANIYWWYRGSIGAFQEVVLGSIPSQCMDQYDNLEYSLFFISIKPTSNGLFFQKCSWKNLHLSYSGSNFLGAIFQTSSLFWNELSRHFALWYIGSIYVFNAFHLTSILSLDFLTSRLTTLAYNACMLFVVAAAFIVLFVSVLLQLL